MIWDYMRFALKNLATRGIRTWLTMLGIFVGIAAVVALISLGQGLQDYINGEFEKIGVNRIIVNPGGAGNPHMAALSSAKLYDKDLRTVLSVRGVDSGIGLLRKVMNMKFKQEVAQVNVFGAEFSKEAVDYMLTVDYLLLAEGRYPKATEKNTAIVGYEIAHSEFDEPIKRGDKITINNTDFEVVAINKKAGNPMHDYKVVIPMDTMRKLYGVKDELSMVMVSVQKGYNLSITADETEKKLRRARDVREGEEDFSVTTAAQVLEQFNSILGIVQAVLGGIAGISLVVGGLGIMTTMYTSVTERTSQIGIMKAVGARNSDILALFLIESGVLGMLGGIIGVLLGLSISFGASYVAMNYFDTELVQASADPWLIFGAISFSFIVGCISGILPSRNAAKMRPVDAIRQR